MTRGPFWIASAAVLGLGFACTDGSNKKRVTHNEAVGGAGGGESSASGGTGNASAGGAGGQPANATGGAGGTSASGGTGGAGGTGGGTGGSGATGGTGGSSVTGAGGEVTGGVGGDPTTASGGSGGSDVGQAGAAGAEGSSDFPFEVMLTVPGTSNLFGAGAEMLPPSTGPGPGTFPPVIELPPGSNRIIQIHSASGSVRHNSVLPLRGPDGVVEAALNYSLNGLVWPVVENRGGFLAAVFLDETTPADPPPAALELTDIDFVELSPELRQIFPVGDGLTGTDSGQQQTIVVPDAATRVFFGLFDRQNSSAEAGWYGDNLGDWQMTVLVDVTT